MFGFPLYKVGNTLIKHLGKPLFFIVRGYNDGKFHRSIIIQRRELFLFASLLFQFEA